MLLGRLAELAPGEAAEAALEHGLGESLLVEAYRRWAAADPFAALDGLAAIAGHAAEFAVALGVLETIGNDAFNRARVLSALPGLEEGRFTVAALERLAGSDPARALAQAERLGSLRQRSLARKAIARAWASTDPDAALAESGVMASEHRDAYRFAVLTEVARRDPERLLDYVDRLDDSMVYQQQLLRLVITEVVPVDPERALELADRIDGPMAGVIKQAAVQVLAAENPEHGLELAAALPAGGEREQVLRATATAFGRRDPDAALGWLESLGAASPDLRIAVLSGMAQADLPRALDLAITMESQTRPSRCSHSRGPVSIPVEHSTGSS